MKPKMNLLRISVEWINLQSDSWGRKRKKTQISHVENERGGDPIDFTEVKRIR